MIILIAGSTGAGKSTYANQLAHDLPGLVYSIDQWMRSLYWQDMPKDPDIKWFQENQQWYVERIQRCEEKIRSIAFKSEEIGQNSLLDLGFSTKDHRASFIQPFVKKGYKVETHFLNIDPEIRWDRVQKRNGEKGETFAMNVDRGMFDYMESIFQAPDENEGATLKAIEN
ncbi:MAG: Zeta toxin [Bdellovibrionaceae bacterium]|nr:Zeta toxin [Pseudobdellovibrionaceae bacterium]|tara:strand:- start:162044 stop:162553 length:510 start_codon:yes stop_codon:yes gene_type:complete